MFFLAAGMVIPIVAAASLALLACSVQIRHESRRGRRGTRIALAQLIDHRGEPP
jgi:hypothetical protein